MARFNGFTPTNSFIRLGGTGAANTLDDYEEGTFSPNIYYTQTGSPTVYKYGKYTKIGNLVTVTVLIRNVNNSSSTFSPRSITNLPYTTENLSQTTIYSGIGGCNTGTFSSLFCYAFKNAAVAYIRERNASGTVGFVTFGVSTTNEMSFQITYPVE
jgi:hypothetical protein